MLHMSDWKMYKYVDISANTALCFWEQKLQLSLYSDRTRLQLNQPKLLSVTHFHFSPLPAAVYIRFKSTVWLQANPKPTQPPPLRFKSLLDCEADLIGIPLWCY